MAVENNVTELAENKAKELIAKFSEFKVGFTTCYLSKIEAKQCALICIDEILNEPKMKFAGEGISDVHYKFWEEVKVLVKS